MKKREPILADELSLFGRSVGCRCGEADAALSFGTSKGGSLINSNGAKNVPPARFLNAPFKSRFLKAK